MTPAPGERLLRFVGDRLSFTLHTPDRTPPPPGWQARLRTNLGRGKVLRNEIIHAHSGKLRLTDASWRDVPMRPAEDGWSLSLPLTEVGYYQSKAYAIDPEGRQHWPGDNDLGISVHPDSSRTANTVYCAFPRMFGPEKSDTIPPNTKWESLLATLDKQGYAVIPPSGKLRDLIQELPHIFGTLGCRILHLLPVNSTPTTYARFGRFGSPYACQDLLAIDPALVEFDKRTTGVDQFRELTYAAHLQGGRVFLDVVINHTGWGSTLQEDHPEWFMRDEEGVFTSPGAWGVTWEDLAELHHRNPALWEHLGDVFLEWCRRGVDGFRCDAGYKIPVPAWRYITARVLEEFPDTIFLLEGLGGPWETTEALLTTGSMQWAYSELFQNYSGQEVARYLDYSLSQIHRVGFYIHYSETHDNDRLAKKGRAWSLLRNRLCALTSANGAFGFTCGVEWLAQEQINVHQCRGLAWNNRENLLKELNQLNQLLTHHPCFFDGATLTRLSPETSPIYALSRVSAEKKDSLLVLVNSDLDAPHSVTIDEAAYRKLGKPKIDLLGQPSPVSAPLRDGKHSFTLPPGGCYCLASTSKPTGLSGDLYRQSRAQAAWAITTICRRFGMTDISPYNWRWLADLVHTDTERFLTAVAHLDPELIQDDLVEALEQALSKDHFPQVVTWTTHSKNRVTVIPLDHCLLIQDASPFRAVLNLHGNSIPQHLSSIQVDSRHIACFSGFSQPGLADLTLERYATENRSIQAQLRFATAHPGFPATFDAETFSRPSSILLTNGIGGMARLQIDLGAIQSKYDCLLGANLHPSVPVDRHIFIKRLRAWIIADGFMTPLDEHNLLEFSPGPPARWRFVASASNDRAVEVHLTADMLQDRNTTLLQFERPLSPPPFGTDLPPDCRVSITVRFDIEDRSFHGETTRNDGADHHFNTHSHPLTSRIGFEFRPEISRRFRVFSDAGAYHHQAEWSQHIGHPVEASRGQTAHGDAFSPGWFDLPLEKAKPILLTACADRTDPPPSSSSDFATTRQTANQDAIRLADLPPGDPFGQQLALALQAFLVRRSPGKTVIAGYPWFLDWGRDSLIVARGLLAAGLVDTVGTLLATFGRFAENGTLPNSLHGEDASNRDTSDAPLWYGLVCQETAAAAGHDFYNMPVVSTGRTIRDTLLTIATGYRDGTPNGIRMDPDSALIWSPAHFTWMDTNYPASTPRQGYPVEIQALWIRLLRLLASLDAETKSEPWNDLAARAERSFIDRFWLEDRGYVADLLLAREGQPANEATADNSLRSNGLFAVSLDLLSGQRARSTVKAALDFLVVPGALRSLAPLPVSPPLAIHAPDGLLLNNPTQPYRGHYQGDEDTSRKLAYHNGTAWTWTLPVFCEALAKAWNFHPDAVTAAKTYLGSMEQLLKEGSIGQLPEILDGDAPHLQRGCDAQAWGVSEALRVWKLLLSRNRE